MNRSPLPVWMLLVFCSGAPLWGKGLFHKDTTSASCKAHVKINYGVVIHNPYYEISRSSGLGNRGLKILREHVHAEQMHFPHKIVYMNDYGYGVPSASQLYYRTTSVSKYLLEQGDFFLLHSCRFFGASAPFLCGPFAKEEMVAADRSQQGDPELAFNFVHGGNQNVFLDGENPLVASPETAHFPDGNGGSVYRTGGHAAMYQVLEEILTSDQPVLFHCKAGIHRTGITGLMVRYLQGGIWTEATPKAGAKESAFYMGVPIPGGVAYQNLAQLEYLQHNRVHFRSKNWRAVEALSHEARFQCLKEKFGPYLNGSVTEAPCESDIQQANWIQDHPEMQMAIDSIETWGRGQRRALWNQCSAL